MMEPPGGTALVEESIAEAIDFRRAMRKVDAEYGDDWFFSVWGGQPVRGRHRFARGLDAEAERPLARLRPAGGRLQHARPDQGDDHHAGADVDGEFGETGIPAAIVTKYLAEHGIIVEKTGLYSFFIMFTIGITKGRWNSMVTELQQFKDDYDNNQPLWRVLPEFVAQHPRYERVGLRDLCTQIHDVYRANDIARLTTEMYLSDMEPAMKPSDAFAKLAHRKIDRVPLDGSKAA